MRALATYFLILGALLCATTSSAEPLPVCYWFGDYDATADFQPGRFGSDKWPNGYVEDYVEYGPNHVDWKANIGAEIVDCSTGRMLVIEIDKPLDSPRDTGDLLSFLDRERDSGNTLDQVRELARRAGYSATMFIDDEERCGCSAFYPELRGDKTPFDADRYYGETE